MAVELTQEENRELAQEKNKGPAQKEDRELAREENKAPAQEENRKLTPEESEYIDRMFRDMYHSLYAYAYGILSNQHMAEESVQETFRVACVRPGELTTSPKPRGWLMEVLKNVLRNAQRKRAMLEKYIASLDSVDLERLAGPDCGNDVDLMYSDLVTPAEFYLLKRVDIEGYTMLEMSEELGISVEACKKRAQRARDKMRQQMKDGDVP